MLIVLGGLPEPRANHVLRELNGDWSQRLDLCYPELKDHRRVRRPAPSRGARQLAEDIRRREALEREGWRFVIVTAEGLYDDPFDTLQRIRLALADRGWHLRSRRIPAEWHRLFTDRPAAL